LQAEVTLARPGFFLDVAVEVAPGETLAVLGPNGAGKSTLLDILAGLLAPDRGTVTVGGRELTRAGAVLVPPERRRVGLLGQDPMLFPHLSATENIAFGPRSQGRTRGAARAEAREWVARMGLAGLADRRPGQLSGGQRQRVALARALAARPDLLLLDEPLGALDARTAPEIRQLLRTHLRASGVLSVLVTHDPLDAAVLADRVLILEDGAVVDRGPTAQVLAAPRSGFGAALAGLNLVPGTVDAQVPAGGLGTIRPGPPQPGPAGGMLTGVAGEVLPAGAAAAAVFPPTAVSLFAVPVTGSPRNHWAATVTGLHTQGAAIRVQTSGPVEIAADVTAAAVAELGLTVGGQVFVAVKATEVTLHRRYDCSDRFVRRGPPTGPDREGPVPGAPPAQRGPTPSPPPAAQHRGGQQQAEQRAGGIGRDVLQAGHPFGEEEPLPGLDQSGHRGRGRHDQPRPAPSSQRGQETQRGEQDDVGRGLDERVVDPGRQGLSVRAGQEVDQIPLAGPVRRGRHEHDDHHGHRDQDEQCRTDPADPSFPPLLQIDREHRVMVFRPLRWPAGSSTFHCPSGAAWPVSSVAPAELRGRFRPLPQRSCVAGFVRCPSGAAWCGTSHSR